jgi:hypothetical protein
MPLGPSQQQISIVIIRQKKPPEGGFPPALHFGLSEAEIQPALPILDRLDLGRREGGTANVGRQLGATLPRLGESPTGSMRNQCESADEPSQATTDLQER